MKILYCGLLYSYGELAKGKSYEHYNLEAGVRQCVEQGLFEADYFYPDEECRQHGKRQADSRFLRLVQQGGYDAIFHVAFNESIDLPAQALKVARLMGIKTIEWDCDASWRFANFIMNRKDRYSHFVTTHSVTVPWYNQFGMQVVRSQWGGSPLYQADPDVEKQYDVVFVGQKHGIRGEFVQTLIDRGIDVHLWGEYWDGFPNWHGYGSFEDILLAFQRGRICLNISNPSVQGTLPQIKGRHFEIPQLGGFQLSTPADDLATYFKFGEEIVVANDATAVAEAAEYYLANPAERDSIAAAGHARMCKDHQWTQRFRQILTEVGCDV